MNNVNELSYTLEKTVSADKNELLTSQQFLETALQTNPCEFLKALSDVLANPANSPVARMAAALQIKNAVTSKNQLEKERLGCRWKSFPVAHKEHIKNNILKSIGTETSRPSSAAQCVAAIACIDLASWHNVIEILCANVINETSSEAMKEASLEAIGYICQDAEHDELKDFSNKILTAIIHGMRKETSNKYIRMAATTALMNSLEFTRGNFENEVERNFIMEVVCETTQIADNPIRVAALQCLVKIMSLYYHYMEPYMAQALFPITLEAMKSDVEEIALQGIEFWSNVSDEEVDLSIEESEADYGQPPEKTSRHYARGALQYLVPILMQKLTQQEESDDDDDWNPCKAASVCLMLLASCCEDSILPHVIPFVQDNIKNPDWRYRDASLMAFGAILGGLKPAMLNSLVETAIPTIIQLMYDSSVVVRDTAAWTIGRICEMTPETAIRDTHLAALLEAMVAGLKGEPRVAANVCWAFSGLAEASYEAAIEQENTEHPSTYCLSPYFDLLMENLLETTNRNDTSQANLRSAAYEGLMEMIKNSPRDCYVTVQRMTLIMLERLNQVLMLDGQVQNSSDRAQVSDLQGLLCATLQSVLRKVTPEDVPKISDQVMTALLQMFRSNSGQAGGVQEDAMLAVTTLVQVMGEGFIKYMESFAPFLFLGLKNHAEYQVCLAAVGVVADLCRELKTAILPYCDDIMTLLLQNLSDNNVHRSVKPQIISLFGDLALAIGPVFDKYIDVVLAMLVQASKTQVDRSEFDMVDYLNELRESILDAYTGMVQGLGNSNAKVEAHLKHIIDCITDWGLDEDLTDTARCTLVGLLGDVCATFGPKIVPITNFELIHRILTKAKRCRLNKTKSHAQWATKEIRKLIKTPS